MKERGRLLDMRGRRVLHVEITKATLALMLGGVGEIEEDLLLTLTDPDTTVIITSPHEDPPVVEPVEIPLIDPTLDGKDIFHD